MPLPDQKHKTNPPRELLVKVLSNSTTVDILRSEITPQQQQVFSGIKEKIREFTSDERTAFADLLLRGIGSENQTWNFKRREAAVVLLSGLPLADMEEETLHRLYIKNIDAQTKPSNEDGP